MSTRDPHRLAAAVKRRRLELYPSRLAAAAAAGISKDTWKKIEDGDPSIREVSYVKVERALKWAQGSCTAVIEGGDPAPVDREGDVETVRIPQSMLPEDVRLAVNDAAMAVTPGMPIREVQALSNQVVEELRRRGILPPSP